MEHFKEGNLENALENNAQDVDSKCIKHILVRIFMGLNYLHETKKMCHGDLKVENICVANIAEENGKKKFYIKLIDFGYTEKIKSIDQMNKKGSF